MKFFPDILSFLNDRKLKWFAIGITLILSGLLTLIGIYGIGEYGIALFILTPLFIGFVPPVILGYKKKISKKEAINTGFITLGLFVTGLIFFAIEGIICIAMAAPFGLLFTFAGSLIACTLINQHPGKAANAIVLLFGIVPLMGFIEKDNEPTLLSVVSSIEIEASPEQVWANVIEFPTLDAPNEFIFSTGIAYPIDAHIEGSGVGAVRHCNFNTGSFVEPITVWDEPKLLKFDVVQQPVPLKELSFWDVDAPHLHDYFVSKRGQFRLYRLANGNTKLEGTTWYYNKIKPLFYWQIWSDYIIHKIHNRVLNHIKINAEKSVWRFEDENK